MSLSPTQAGAPTFPNILGAFVPSVTLVNLTTMDPNLQNAYSRQANVEIEQQVGDRATLGVGYQYVRGLNLLMSVNQNVPLCVPSGTNNGCRPNPTYANNSQYSAAGESSYHGLNVSFIQRPTRWGQYRISYTLSTSKNNVGEFFFSSPIDPFDLSKDWGRSDDDQRHRLVFHGTVHSSSAPATTVWQHISHGFELSGMVQTYSRLPFNVTSGVTTLYGTAGRPIVNGDFIERNAGIGSDFFSLNARVTRTFQVTGATGAAGAGRRLQPHEPSQWPDAQHQLRAWGVPDEPAAGLRTDHRRQRTALVPVRAARQLLKASRMMRVGVAVRIGAVMLGRHDAVGAVAARGASPDANVARRCGTVERDAMGGQ